MRRSSAESSNEPKDLSKRQFIGQVLACSFLIATPVLAGSPDEAVDWVKLADEDPVKVLLKFHSVPEGTISVETLEKAAWKAVEVQPSAVLLFYDRCKKLKSYPKLLRAASFASAKRTPSATLSYLGRYEDEDYCRDVLLICADIYAIGVLHFMREHVKKPWAEAVYLKIAEKYPNEVTSDQKYFSKETWAKKVLAYSTERLNELIKMHPTRKLNPPKQKGQ